MSFTNHYNSFINTSSTKIMKQIRIIIEKGKDQYGAYAENIAGIYGAGDTIAETKQSIIEAIDLFKEFNTEKNTPGISKGEYGTYMKI